MSITSIRCLFVFSYTRSMVLLLGWSCNYFIVIREKVVYGCGAGMELFCGIQFEY